MKKVFLLSLMLGVAPAALADYRMTPREAVYYWASQGHLKNLKALQKSGYSLDMPDIHGRQAVCEAVDKNDVKAFKTLKKAGANMNVFCLYNMSQEKRYEFNQAYYGLPLVVPVMTESMLEEEIAVIPTTLQPQPVEYDVVEIQQQEEALPTVESVQYTSESYEDSSDGVYSSDSTESVVFRPYVAANLFYGREKSELKIDDDTKRSEKMSGSVPGLALAFGTKVSDFRAELAIQGHGGFSEKVMDGEVKSKVQSYAGLLNAYYDIPTGTSLTPYVGAGVGFARNRASLSDNTVKYSGSDWSFAWQLAAGLNYALTDNLVADLGYRYTNYGKVNVVNENGVKYKVDDIKMHNVTLGLRYEL